MKHREQSAAKRRKLFTRQFYRGNTWNLTLAVLDTLMTVACNLVISWLMQQMIDVSGGKDTGFTLAQLGLIGLACILGIVVSCGLSYISKPRFLSRAMAQYKNFVFGEISKKSISAFSGENTSLYISALSNDANTIETDYLAKFFTLITQILLFLGAFVMMFWYSPLLTLISIALALLPVLASIFAGNRMAAAEAVVSQKNESFMSTLKDSLAGFSVVKSFQAETAMCRLFAQSVQGTEDAKCRKRKISVVLQMLASVAGVIAQMGVFLVGAWMSLTGRGVSPGVVIVFVQLMNYVIQPIGEVPQILAGRKSANALIDKLAAALSENVRDEGQQVERKLQDAIELKNLSFSYDGEKEVLHNISTRFEAGKSYALVGASGSGKSTILNLLMASHNNYTGEINYDGIELRKISGESLYKLVSIIQQNVFVFNNSIRDNITMFHDFPAQEVSRAIQLSGVSGLIQERGEAYLCGENGSGLSGGEKQRISIARSLLRKSPVLLVDEATAALDAETAFHVSDSILDLEGLTRIVVTHTLDAPLMKRYDRILALKNGSLVEEGTFDELMEKKGYFYSLFTVSQ